MARPKEIDVSDLIEKLDKFVDINEEPLLQQFIIDYGISESYLYKLSNDNEELKESIKRAVKKQELYLIKNAQSNKINPTFAIFRLKQPQFGYTDKQDITNTIKNSENETFKVDLSGASDDEIKKMIKNAKDE